MRKFIRTVVKGAPWLAKALALVPEGGFAEEAFAYDAPETGTTSKCIWFLP